MDDTKLATVKPGMKFNPVEFYRETRRELAKVTWPSRNDTLAITAKIIFMAILTGLFFWGVDSVLGYVISRILGMKQ